MRLINKVLIISFALILIVCSIVIAYYYWPITIEGIIDHKTIVGVKDDAVMAILSITPHGVVIKDEDFKWLLVNAEKFTLSRVIELLRPKYDEIYCTVSIRLTKGDPLNGLAPWRDAGICSG